MKFKRNKKNPSSMSLTKVKTITKINYLIQTDKKSNNHKIQKAKKRKNRKKKKKSTKLSEINMKI